MATQHNVSKRKVGGRHVLVTEKNLVIGSHGTVIGEIITDHLGVEHVARSSSKRYNRFKEKVLRSITKQGFLLKSAYVDSTTKVVMECIVKKHKIIRTPGNILSSEKQNNLVACNKCRKELQAAGTLGLHVNTPRCQKKFEELKLEAKEKGWMIIGPYVDHRVPVKVRCLDDPEHEDTIFPNFVKRCQICKMFEKLSLEFWFVEHVEKRNGKVLAYNGYNYDAKIQCFKNHIVLVTPCTVIRSPTGTFCSFCTGRAPELKSRQLQEILTGCGVTMVGEYTNMHNNVECICPKGHPCSLNPNHLFQKFERYKKRNSNKPFRVPCWTCASRDQKVNEQEFKKLVADKFKAEVLGVWVDTKTKIKCKCANNHICFPVPGEIKRGCHICSQCNHSQGEFLVGQALKEMKLDFDSPYVLPRISKERKAAGIPGRPSYDFRVKNVLIEYDGHQHFSEIAWKKRDLSERHDADIAKIRDALKDGYKIVRLHFNWMSWSPESRMVHLKQCMENPANVIVSHLAKYKWLPADIKVVEQPLPTKLMNHAKSTSTDQTENSDKQNSTVTDDSSTDNDNSDDEFFNDTLKSPTKTLQANPNPKAGFEEKGYSAPNGGIYNPLVDCAKPQLAVDTNKPVIVDKPITHEVARICSQLVCLN
jgi:hypothetical protein